ncbi:hypothetical protein V500_07305 [Pseudogymnoascus sp. VKM F-4518 (FW-2643)]|nr:hypothetical protein V500_07305 [Pseudogymnoascus sp. VKM F-4518 (FW-2643)]
MDVNIRGVLFMTQAVIPHLQQPGRIMNLGSVLGRVAMQERASELYTLGHTVNTIAPGLTETDMMAEVMKKQGPAGEQALSNSKDVDPT